MSSAEDLLNNLTGIGATIETVEGRLLLRAGPTAIPGTLVRRIREAKRDLLGALAAQKDHAASRTHQAITSTRSFRMKLCEMRRLSALRSTTQLSH